MSDKHSPAEGTIRDPRPGDPLGDTDAPRVNLSVLNVSHQRFRILGTYAEGGLGVVSTAHDIELDRVVAVKEMRGGRPSDDDVQRFLLEARLTGQLDHPGIPPVYALGYFEDGRPFYAMRLVDGVTLRSAIKEFHNKFPAPDRSRQRSMQLRQLIGAMVSICNTLRFAHSKGVLHRDIKPSNIMLGEYGETLLMDWGLAKSQKQSLPYSDLEAKAHLSRKRLDDPEDTGTGSVMGTPHYMSPEQANGDIESINPRSEVYSVGATLYTVLTGRPPFSGQTRDEILNKVKRGDFQPPRAVDSRVPPELNAICLKAMALERGDRYADPGELATDIEHWLADETVPCYREPPSRRWQRWVKANQVWVAGLAALMATCFIGLLVGTYLVSVEHRESIAASQRADEATQKADDITQQTRDLLSRTFVTTFNNRIRNIPGTERTRLEVLELFIEQFERWSQAETGSDRDQHELAQAFYERSLIYDELNDVERAWADMSRALQILDQLMQSSDVAIRSACLLDRIHLQSMMVRLQNELRWNRHAAEELGQQMYVRAVSEVENNPRAASYKFYLAEAALQFGLAKRSRGFNSEAMELVTQAHNICERLMSPDSLADLERQLVGGADATVYLALLTKCELAKSAYELGDRDLARQQSLAVDRDIHDLQLKSTANFDAWTLMLDNQISMVKFGLSERNPGIDLRMVVRKIDALLKERKQHRRLLQMRAETLLQLVSRAIFEGDFATAQADLLSAWHSCAEIEDMGIHTGVLENLLTQVHELAIEIAQVQGDVNAERLHEDSLLTLQGQGCAPQNK